MNRQLYIIVHPQTTNRSGMWTVLKRNRWRKMEHVAEVTSYESAVATLPAGLVKQDKVFDLEFWE